MQKESGKAMDTPFKLNLNGVGDGGLDYTPAVIGGVVGGP